MILRVTAAATVALLIIACGGEREPEGAPPSGAAQAGTNLTPDEGGSIVQVEMLTDDAGNNIFRPADFEVREGDVIRFVLVTGVHNAHFLPDSSPGARGLPPVGPLLQLPGQAYDVKVTWEEGRYFYQCDPHALLGMVGHVTVRDDD